MQTPNDPGPTIRLQVSPVAAAPSTTYPMASGEVMSAPAGTISMPAVVAGATTVYPAYGAPVYPAYAYPAYYPGYAYYPPVGISLGFGFGGGWGGGHHRHWR